MITVVTTLWVFNIYNLSDNIGVEDFYQVVLKVLTYWEEIA